MTRPQVTLHVGHGKTGSSFLQSSLALSRRALSAKGITYAEHASFSAARSGKITSGNVDPFGFAQDILSATSGVSAGHFLFSSEHMFLRLMDQPEALQAMTDCLDVRVILFIRDPFEHCLSAYGQNIKRDGFTGEIGDYLGSYRFPELVSAFLHLLNTYGASVTVRNYTRHKSDLLTVFAAMLAPGLDLTPPPVEIVNRSLTRAEMQIQRRFNKELGRGSSRFVSDALCNALPDIRSEPPRVPLDAYERFFQAQQPFVEEVKHQVDEAAAYHLTSPEAYGATLSDDPSDLVTLSGEQLDLLVSSICREMRRDAGLDRIAEDLRDLALEIEKGTPVGLADAYMLMRAAHMLRPNGPVIRQKMEAYAAALTMDA